MKGGFVEGGGGGGGRSGGGGRGSGRGAEAGRGFGGDFAAEEVGAELHFDEEAASGEAAEDFFEGGADGGALEGLHGHLLVAGGAEVEVALVLGEEG